MCRPLRWATRALPLTRKLLQKLDQKSLNTDEAIYIVCTPRNHQLFGPNSQTLREERKKAAADLQPLFNFIYPDYPACETEDATLGGERSLFFFSVTF